MTNPDLKRREYPEFSQAAIGAVVTGLMDILPDATNGTPKARAALMPGEFALLNDLPLWSGTVTQLYEGRARYTLTNQPAKPMLWLPEGSAVAVPVPAGETSVFHSCGQA